MNADGSCGNDDELGQGVVWYGVIHAELSKVH